MKNYNAFLISFSILLASPAFAEDQSSPYWEVILMGGTAALDANNTLIHVSDTETDKITQDNSGDWKSWTVQLGLGYVVPLFESERLSNELQWFPSLEPQINAYFLKGNIEGQVNRFYQSPGDYSDTDYKIALDSTRLMFDMALTLFSYRNLSIYALAGIGPSWNRVKYDTGVNEGAELHLNAHTQTNFAYEFSAGASYSLSEHLSLTAQYLYAGFNDLKFGESGTEGDNREISDVKTKDFDVNTQAVLLGFRLAF